MATRSAGRVTIRVIPDSTSFRRDLKTALDRIENTQSVTIPAHLSVTRESVAKLKEQLRDLEVKIKVEPVVTQEQLHELKKNIEDVDPDVRVGLNSRLAGARLAYLTRDREVSVFVRINKASLVAATQALAALSGARFLGNVFEKFWDSIKNLDKSAPRIAAISSGFITLAGVLGAAVSNMAGLAVSFAQLGQSAVLLPALLTGAGISIGVLIAAFKDMKTVLGDLAPAFHKLQDNISKKFWDQAAQPIRDMVNTLLPTLNRELGQLAAAWGRLFAALSNEIKNNVTPEELTKMMGNLTRAVEIATRAMKPLVASFNTLGSFGSEYLPRLSEWLVKLSNQFNDFIQGAAADGSLRRWAETGITAFKDLGRVIYQTVRVFAALSKAATAAGGSSFAMLADGLRKLADTMNTANFQTTFITILASAHDVVDGLVRGLNNLGPGLASFAPTIARVFDTVGRILERVGAQISKLLAVPELQNGVERIFSGLLTFVANLGPVMEPLGRILGVLGDVIGTVLSNFSELLAAVAPYLAPLFEDVWKAIKPLIPTLVDLAIQLLPPFVDILTVLAQDVLPELVPIIKELAPIFVEIVKAFAPVIVQFLKDFAGALKDLNTVLPGITGGIKDLTTNFNGLPKAFYQSSTTGIGGGFLGTMGQFAMDHPDIAMFLGGFGKGILMIVDSFKAWQALGDLKSVGDTLIGFASMAQNGDGFLNFLGQAATGIAVLTGTLGGWNAFWTGMTSIVQTLVPGIGPIMTSMGQTVTQSIQGVQNLLPNWQNFWSSLQSPVQLAFQLVTGEVTNGMGVTLGRMLAGFLGLKANWESNWPTLLPTVTTTLANVAGSVSLGFPGVVASVIGGMVNVAASFGRGWLNVLNEIPGWFAKFANGVGAGIVVVVARLAGLPNQMIAVLFSAAGRFIDAGLSLIQNFAAGISRGASIAELAIQGVIAAVTKHLPGSPAKVGPLSGRGYSLLRGQRMVEDFAEGMKARTDAVKSASFGVASAVQFGGGNASATSVVSATSGTAPLVNIEGDYYGATPEQVADDFDKKVRRANTVHQITKVMK